MSGRDVPARPLRSGEASSGRDLRLATWFVLGALAAGIVARLWILTGPLGRANSDDAVVGLMARGVLDGHLAVYYWDQGYGGSQEALLTALMFAVAGTSTVALKAVPIALYAAAAVVVWRIGLRAVGEPAARVAGALAWAYPAWLVVWSTRAGAFYAFTTVCGLTVVLAALRLVDRPAARDAVVLGAATGLGYWASPHVFFFALPAVAWALWRRPDLVRLAWVAVAAALVGALPSLLDSVVHGRLPSTGAGSPFAGYGARLRVFLEGLPHVVGLRTPWEPRWLVPGGEVVGPVLTVVAVAGAVAALVLAVTREQRRGAEPVLAAVLLYPLLFALSPVAIDPGFARYFSYAVPLLAIGAGWWLLRSRAVLAAGSALLLVLLVAGLVAIDRNTSRTVAPQVRPADLGPLVDALDARGIDHLVAEYWLAYQLTFETGERIVATPNQRMRNEDMRDEVVADPDGLRTYAFVAGSVDECVFLMRSAQLGVDHVKVETGETTLYLLARRLWPARSSVPLYLSFEECTKPDGVA